MRRVDVTAAVPAVGTIVLACSLDLLDDGTALSKTARLALLFLWIAGVLRAGRFFAHKAESGERGSGTILAIFLFSYLYILLALLLAGIFDQINTIVVTIPAALGFLFPKPSLPDFGMDGGEAAGGSGGGLLRFLKEHPLAALVVFLSLGLVVANTVFAVLLPPFAHDDLSYHLVFPAEWMQKGTIETRAIPFGNHSPPYYPMNTELFYLWLLLPLREAFHLNAAQVVFLGVSVLALRSIFRRCGAGRAASITAASLFCVSPVVVPELARAYVDLAFAAFFLMALDSCLAFRERPTTSRWLQFVAISGLFVGTKILGAVLGLLFVLPFFGIVLWFARREARSVSAVRVVRNLLFGVIVFLACGGWWYVRNYLLTGNPVFPLEVEICGVTLFPGAYRRTALPESLYSQLLDFFDPVLLWLFLAGAAVTILAAVWSRRPMFLLIGIVAPIYLALLFGLVVPFNYPRFVLAAYGLACAVFLLPLGASRPWRLMAESVIAVGLIGILFFEKSRTALLLPLLEPRLAGDTLVWGAFTLGCFALVLLLILCIGRWKPRSGMMSALLVAVPSVLLLLFFNLASRVADPGGACFVEGFRNAREPFILVHEKYFGKKVAVTGTNQSFLLYGKGFSNSVAYVSVNSRQGWMFHDHVKNFEGDRTALMEDRNGARYYRNRASYPDWIVNLDTWGADLLVCSRLMPWNQGREKGYVYDARGFPLESIWAERHDRKFRKVFESPFYKIFEVIE